MSEKHPFAQQYNSNNNQRTGCLSHGVDSYMHLVLLVLTGSLYVSACCIAALLCFALLHRCIVQFWHDAATGESVQHEPPGSRALGAKMKAKLKLGGLDKDIERLRAREKRAAAREADKVQGIEVSVSIDTR